MNQVKAVEYTLSLGELRTKFEAIRESVLKVFGERAPFEVSDFFGEFLRKCGFSFEMIGTVVSPGIEPAAIQPQNLVMDEFMIRHAFLTWRGQKQYHNCAFEVQIFVEFCISLGFRHVDILKALYDTNNQVEAALVE